MLLQQPYVANICCIFMLLMINYVKLVITRLNQNREILSKTWPVIGLGYVTEWWITVTRFLHHSFTEVVSVKKENNNGGHESNYLHPSSSSSSLSRLIPIDLCRHLLFLSLLKLLSTSSALRNVDKCRLRDPISTKTSPFIPVLLYSLALSKDV